MSRYDDVVERLNKGMKNKDIAEELGISPSIVSTMKRRYESKKDFENNPENAYKIGLQKRLVDIGCPEQMVSRIVGRAITSNKITSDGELVAFLAAYKTGEHQEDYIFRAFGAACYDWCAKLLNIVDVESNTEKCNICGKPINLLSDEYVKIISHIHSSNANDPVYICYNCYKESF